MSAANFPVNFPNGPIVDPKTGRMAPGLNGTYFFLALFNRTGAGAGLGATARQTIEGITISMLGGSIAPATPRTVADGLTLAMLK